MPKPYPPEFREDVVRVARKREASLVQIAKDFGISDATLSNRLRPPRAEELGEAPADSRGEDVRIRAGVGVGEDADREEAVVGERRHAHAQVAPQRYEGDDFEHARPQHVERYVGPRHVGHDQVDKGLTVHEVAGRRYRRRRQGV